MDFTKSLRNTISIKFNDHVTVDQKKPFTVYSISVITNMYSKFNLVKRYSNFVDLKREMEQYSNDEILKHGSKKMTIPDFPNSSLYYWNLDDDFILSRKVELEQYSQSLVNLYCKLTMMSTKQNESLPSLQIFPDKGKTLNKILGYNPT